MPTPVRILIVDDHPFVRRFLRLLLAVQSHWQIFEADNGTMALEKARQIDPHVVVLDIVMPEKNGIETALEIRQLKPAPKIILMSSHYTPGEASIIGRLYGDGDFIPKSEANKVLIPAISRLLPEESRARKMWIERQRASRYNFGAIAEVIDLEIRTDLVCVTRDLSQSGCFLKTTEPFAEGAEVRVRIRHSGADFAALGKVTSDLTPEGMGIEFLEIEPKDQATLEAWLGIASTKEAGSESSSPKTDVRLIRAIPIIVSGQLSTGTFSEETETQIITPEAAVLFLSTAVSAGQLVRVKNRLTRMEQDCRIVFVGPTQEEDTAKLLAIEFLKSVPNFWGIEPAPKNSPRSRSN
jgi:DNA-binding response OmpR family regulator